MSVTNSISLSDGRKLSYAEYGDQKGIPLIFFHGWPNSRLHAEVIHDDAAKLGIRVISPDRPGYGLSDYRSKRSMLDFIDDIEELVNKLGIDKFIAIGNSGGGPYALACAYKIPHRLTKVGVVVGLTPTDVPGVLDGMALFNKIGWKYYRQIPFLTQIATNLVQIKANYFSSTIAFDFSSPSDNTVLKSIDRDVLVRRRREAFIQGMKGPGLDLQLYSKDWGFPLNKITKEIHLWYGEKDKKVSSNMGKYLATQLIKSTLTIFPNEGHMILDKHTEEILTELVSQ